MDGKNRSCFKLTPYIDDEGLKNLHIFKYNGSDSGIAYRLFYNRAALWCVDHISENIAPNVLTLFGFIFTLVPFLFMFAYYGTDFGAYSKPIDNWFIICLAFFYFTYRMLDEMDGK